MVKNDIIYDDKFNPIKAFNFYIRNFYLINFSKIIFIHINKTGGSSIEKALGLPLQKHLTALEFRNKLGKKKYNKRFKFAFIRNPYDKVVSQYSYRFIRNAQNLQSDNISFEEWIKLTFIDKNPIYRIPDNMYDPQLDWVADENGNIIVDFIGRFESLNEDFNKVCEKIGVKGKNLPHLRKSKHEGYRTYYNDFAKSVISKCFKKDIEAFGYKF